MIEVKYIGVKEKANVFSLRKEFVSEKTGTDCFGGIFIKCGGSSYINHLILNKKGAE